MKRFKYFLLFSFFVTSGFFSPSLSAFQALELSSHPITGAQLVKGFYHSCIIIAGGVYCWGKNDYGQLGNGTYVSSDTPVKVQGIKNATALSAYGEHSCAVLSDGTASCWGLNDYSKLNNPAINMVLYNNTPLPVAGVSNAASIVEGSYHTCVLTKSETVNCWGYNDDGQLGNGNVINSALPVSVLNLTSVAVLASGDEHNCALIKDGSVKCWGNDYNGQLGNGYVKQQSTTPVLLPGVTNATAIDSGSKDTCIVVKGGDVLCWGVLNGSSPEPISEIDNAVAVSVGDGHTCALIQDGNVKCWGKYPGTTTYLSKNQIYLSDVAILSTRGGQCGILKDGSVNCWNNSDTPKVINLDPSLIQAPIDTMMCEKADLNKAQQDNAVCMNDLNKAKTKIQTLQSAQTPACNYIKLLPPYMQKLPAAMAKDYSALYQRIFHSSGCQ